MSDSTLSSLWLFLFPTESWKKVHRLFVKEASFEELQKTTGRAMFT